MAIARAAARNNVLEQFITTFYAGAWQSSTFAARPLRDMRIAFEAVPASAVVRVGRPSDIVRAVTRRVPHGEMVTTASMYWAKRRFDAAASACLGAADVVIGIEGSAAETLRRAKSVGALAVLNFVNSHPRVHNAALARARVPTRNEYVPSSAARAEERELEVADVVLVPSQYVARQLREVGIPPERVEVIPYGVDLERFQQAPDAYRDRSRLHVLFVGQICYRKGVAVILETARELLNRSTFDLIGPVVAPRLVRDLPSNVHHQSTAARDVLPALLGAADVFVSPSLDDAYSLATLEAMATGLPVIVSDRTGASELIRPWENGVVVEAGDADALRNALVKLEDPSLRASIGRSARATVERAHSWQDYGDRVISALDARLANDR